MLSKKINRVNLLLVSLVFLLSVNSAHASVGKIIYGYGNNYALDSDGNRRDLKKGSEIREGDTLVTGRGRMHVRLIDGGFVSVYPNSEYRIDKFKFSGKKVAGKASVASNKKEKSVAESKEDRGVFSLLKGAARQVTGLLGRTYNKNFRFKTAVATIGIRGTGFYARLCQADCFDADGHPMQDGLHVKNNTGIITVKTSVGELTLAQGQSAFVASNEDYPEQTVQPPIAYHTATPDLELYDFDQKIIGFNQELDIGIQPPIDPGVNPPVVPPAAAVTVTNLEYVTSDTTSFPAPFGGVNTANATDSVQQTGNSIDRFEGVSVYLGSGVLIFDKDLATLSESGVDANLGVIWNRWSGGYSFTEDGTDVPQGNQAGNDIHIIGSDNITANLAGLTGKGTVNYVSTGGTAPTVSGFAAATQTGTQSISASINYNTAEVTNFQLDVNYGATTMSTNLLTVTFLSGTSGNSVDLTGSCTGTECGFNGGGVNGKASINLVGPSAEGIYGVYNLTNQENAVSGSYVATDAAQQN